MELKKSVSLPLSEAQKIYTEENVYKLVNKNIFGDIINRWPYYDADHNVQAVDIYFKGNKTVIPTFWYDGENLNIKSPPILIYNLPAVLISEKPILILKYPKFIEIVIKELKEFTPCSWNAGFGKEMLAPWENLKDKKVYIYLGDHKSSLKVATNIKKQLPQAKIVKLLKEAKELKKRGSNIEEALKYMPPEEFSKYLLNPENHYTDDELLDIEPENPPALPDAKAPQMLPSHSGSFSKNLSKGLPFKILGIGDDGKAAFITEAGRLVSYKLESLGKEKMRVLANRGWWISNYGHDYKITTEQWENAMDDIIRLSEKKDFDENNIRGRGAWRDDEKISYHDGLNTYGEYEKKKIYLRLPQHDIGINDNPASKELCQAVKNIIFKLSFETPADAVRTMGWSILGPFAGALKFRPAILLTGPSGSGKTTITNLCIKKLADCEWLNGSETTVAGFRGKVKFDTRSCIFEETDPDTQKKSQNRNDLFSMMRASISDDAPDIIKGTKEGGFNSFKMQNMFGFISVDPSVENIADENRIFRINMVRPTNGSQWKDIENNLKKLLSEKNCRAIRALTWNKLKIIFDLADRIVDAIREKTGKDYRSSYADALLSSAFMIIWTGTDNPTDKQIDEMLEKYYQFQPPEEHRDEAAEFLDRILEEQIEILHDNSREKLSILECMNRICTDGKVPEDNEDYWLKLDDYRKTLSRYGIRVDGKQLTTGEIAIANNHHIIKKITGHNTGYNRIFQRHKGLVDGNRTVYYLDGKNRRSTIIKGLLLKKDSDDEIAELIF